MNRERTITPVRLLLALALLVLTTARPDQGGPSLFLGNAYAGSNNGGSLSATSEFGFLQPPSISPPEETPSKQAASRGSNPKEYAFCGGNPGNRRDPFGLDEKPKEKSWFQYLRETTEWVGREIEADLRKPGEFLAGGWDVVKGTVYGLPGLASDIVDYPMGLITMDPVRGNRLPARIVNGVVGTLEGIRDLPTASPREAGRTLFGLGLGLFGGKILGGKLLGKTGGASAITEETAVATAVAEESAAAAEAGFERAGIATPGNEFTKFAKNVPHPNNVAAVAAHGQPGLVQFMRNGWINAEALWTWMQATYPDIANITEIRLYVCKGGAIGPAGTSVVEDLARVSGRYVQGFVDDVLLHPSGKWRYRGKTNAPFDAKAPVYGPQLPPGLVLPPP